MTLDLLLSSASPRTCDELNQSGSESSSSGNAVGSANTKSSSGGGTDVGTIVRGVLGGVLLHPGVVDEEGLTLLSEAVRPRQCSKG